MKRRMLPLTILAFLLVTLALGWNFTARAAYESAPYQVVKKSGNIEIRDYPDLMLAATSSKVASNGRDGSFMRLFRYISGDNESKEKISMTTPVFMEGGVDQPTVSMGFVMPKSVAKQGVPAPTGDGVEIQTRKGGRFAVIRFSGRMDSDLASTHEKKLRQWLREQGLEGEASADTAGYDPPFTPGPFRRNEVLIRIANGSQVQASDDATDPTPDEE